MLYFYDGQVRRYITQIVRMLSNFSVQDSEGKQTTIPVSYGDLTRQVANIIRDNSENKLPSAPRIAVYITALELDRDRTSDATFVRKTNVVEREYDDQGGVYLNTQGKNYTVERLMPTPYLLRVNADLWSTNTDQKLQMLEQILVMFNPSLEIQTTDNYIDWTSLSVVHLENVQFTNRNIPVGVDSEIDIATLTFSTPIYISPPAAVKRLGAITNIITSMFDENTGTIDLEQSQPELNRWDDFPTPGRVDRGEGKIAETEIARHTANVNYSQYGVYVNNNQVSLVKGGVIDANNWRAVLETLPGSFRTDVSRIYLTSLDTNTIITGTIGINALDERKLVVNWDEDSFPDDSILSSSYADRTSFDYIIDPQRFDPRTVTSAGTRLLLLDSVGDEDNTEGADAWKNNDGTYFVADANDIVEWNGSKWNIVFDASETTETIYQTNLNTGQQYRFVNDEWLLSVEGEYPVGTWRIDLYG